MIAWLLTAIKVISSFFLRLFPFLGRMFNGLFVALGTLSSRVGNSWVVNVLLTSVLLGTIVLFFTNTLFTWASNQLGNYILSFDVANSVSSWFGGWSVYVWDSGLYLSEFCRQLWLMVPFYLSALASCYGVRLGFWGTINATYKIR